ncbi:MAG: hypothetical protein J3K34DRAFT_498051 [Monoraphidium minutum]|nr:MAG: hypothetical protein J3K34DRAFT_498051 [Monoraphidium minutum]
MPQDSAAAGGITLLGPPLVVRPRGPPPPAAAAEPFTPLDAVPGMPGAVNMPALLLPAPLNAKRLRTALVALMTRHPHLAGRIRPAPSHARGAPAYELACTGAGATLQLARAAWPLAALHLGHLGRRGFAYSIDGGAPPAGKGTPGWYAPLSGAALLAGDAPLLQVQLTTAADGGCMLALTLPHVLADAHTTTRLLETLAALYRGGAPPAAEPSAKAWLRAAPGAAGPLDPARLRALSLHYNAAAPLPPPSGCIPPAAPRALWAAAAAAWRMVRTLLRDARRFRRPMRDLSCAAVWVPAAGAAALKRLAAAAGGNALVSTNDALAALWWVTVCDLRRRPLPGAAAATGGGGGGGGAFGMAIDLRRNGGLRLPPDLIGNAASCLYVPRPGGAPAAGGGAPGAAAPPAAAAAPDVTLDVAEGARSSEEASVCASVSGGGKAGGGGGGAASGGESGAEAAAALRAAAAALRGALTAFRSDPHGGAALLATLAAAAAPGGAAAAADRLRALATLGAELDGFITSWTSFPVYDVDFGVTGDEPGDNSGDASGDAAAAGAPNRPLAQQCVVAPAFPWSAAAAPAPPGAPGRFAAAAAEGAAQSGDGFVLWVTVPTSALPALRGSRVLRALAPGARVIEPEALPPRGG